MKLIFHGAVHEVGRSCIELQTKNTRLLLDCGVKLGPEESEYPEIPKSPKTFDALLLSHAHLDHCAGIPYMHSKGLNCPMFMTPATRNIAKILIKDFHHVESLSKVPEYNKSNIDSAFHQFRVKQLDQMFRVKDAEITFLDAGHIPGSAVTIVESEGKRVAYTGDINLSETRLMDGADINIGQVDVLITETTYGNKEHPSRANTEKEFIMKTREVLARGGNVYVPVFGVGRAQEILLLLHNYSWDVPIHLDGMSQDVTDLIINDKACRDPKLLRKAAEKTIYLHGRIQRARAMKQQGIFVTTSGMLTGGPIIDYLKENWNDAQSAFLLTGYVIEGTNGRTLLEQGYVTVDGVKLKVKAEYHQYDFSAHAGLSELRILIQKLNPKTLILVHGDDEALNNLANENKKKRKVFIPKLGDEIVV